MGSLSLQQQKLLSPCGVCGADVPSGNSLCLDCERIYVDPSNPKIVSVKPVQPSMAAHATLAERLRVIGIVADRSNEVEDDAARTLILRILGR